VSQHDAKQVAMCLFSGLSGANAGGVQESGRIAWHAVVEHARSVGGSAALLVYGEAEDADLELGCDSSLAETNRWSFLRKAAMRRWDTPLLCFWHLDLLQLLPLLRVGDTEVVLFLHGIEAWRPQSWLVQRFLPRVNRFLSNSQFTWQRFLEFQPQLVGKPHQVVPLGIGEALLDEPPTPDEPPTALMLGRLQKGEDYKGHREIITAWPGVRERVPGALLWIAGDGDLRPELEALADRVGVSDAVCFWGRVSDGQKQDLLQRSRCMAMPSRGEGFGLVYLEAMRLGRPCLVSNCDAGQEVVSPPDAGLAVDPGQPGELIEALGRLLGDGAEWNQFAHDSRRRYQNAFTARQFQRRLVDALFGPQSRTSS
jgi:phosphatidylinositol alpha-1,6-mannosyltransferase